MMQLPIALNTILGSALIVALVFANYIRKYNADRFQWTMFCGLLLFTFIAMLSDMLFMLLEGKPGKTVWLALHVICVSFYFFQVLSFYSIGLFVDYMLFKNPKRSSRIAVAVVIITVIHIIILALNIQQPFYYDISKSANIFSRGDTYIIRLVFSYCPILLAVWDVIISPGAFKRSHVLMTALLIGLPFTGSALDMLVGSMRLIWPCMTAALLYSYFFMVRSDSRLDTLTGIGNRFSFNEFTDKLSRHNTGESWAIVMIDMDHFKHINDTLGHQAGDQALQDMAGIIKNGIRGSDFAARYGGDEFVLAIRVENGIVQRMREIQEAVDRHNAKKARPFKLEISYGYDVYTADGRQSIDEFLSHIDGLMYRHKQDRRRASDKKNEAGKQ